jgi:hypothetical protein
MKRSHRHSAEGRLRIAEATRAAMAAPEVRQRISDRTKRGMKSLQPELERLRAVWLRARPSVRRMFVNHILAPLFAKKERP